MLINQIPHSYVGSVVPTTLNITTNEDYLTNYLPALVDSSDNSLL